MLATGKGTAMGLTRKRMLELMGATAAGSVAASLTSSTAGASAGGPVIRRDVCVIGGGSAGTYTAVRLGDLGRERGRGGVEEPPRRPHRDPPRPGHRRHRRHRRDRVRGRSPGPRLLRPVRGGARADRWRWRRRAARRTSTSAPADRSTYTPPVPIALPAYYELISQYGPIDTVFDLPDPVPPDLVAPFADYVTQARPGLDRAARLQLRPGHRQHPRPARALLDQHVRPGRRAQHPGRFVPHHRGRQQQPAVRAGHHPPRPRRPAGLPACCGSTGPPPASGCSSPPRAVRASSWPASSS